MASKLNIFNALPNVPSDDEEEHGHKGSHSGPGGVKKDRVRNRGKKTDGTGSTAQAGKDSHAKDLKSRDHVLKKAANDLDHPHTLDRKSGTGHQAFGRTEKKGGAGKFNKGSYKDDLRGQRGEGERAGDEGEDQVGSGEEEDNTVTWEDYISRTAAGETRQQVNDAKAKITDDQLKKELGKATLLQNRKEKQIDDYTETHKKDKTTPVVGMNTEHAELLGFRTGFKVFDGPKKRPQYGDKPAEKEGEATKTEGGNTEENKGEAGAAAEDTTKTDEKSPEGGQKGGYRGKREGGYKGEGRGGYKGEGRGGYKGDNRGGYKGDNRGGQKGGYKGGEKKATFNADDESLFPKLG